MIELLISSLFVLALSFRLFSVIPEERYSETTVPFFMNSGKVELLPW